MTLLMVAEFALIGLVAGYLAGFLGIGGGFVVVPALTLLLLRDPATAANALHIAIATSLATMLVTSLSSLIAHHRKGAIRWSLVRSMAAGLMSGAVIGAVIANFLPADNLASIFGVFAILAGLQLIFARQPEAEKPLPRLPELLGTGSAIGAVSSLIGIGGGAMTVPWLLWHGVRAQTAIGTSSACGYPIAVAGTLSFILLGRAGDMPGGWLGYVNGPAFIGIAAFSVLAAPLGAATVHRLSPKLIKRIFGFFLLLVGARMLVGF
jgi:uncharacterized membrane protein YfcA